MMLNKKKRITNKGKIVILLAIYFFMILLFAFAYQIEYEKKGIVFNSDVMSISKSKMLYEYLSKQYSYENIYNIINKEEADLGNVYIFKDSYITKNKIGLDWARLFLDKYISDNFTHFRIVEKSSQYFNYKSTYSTLYDGIDDEYIEESDYPSTKYYYYDIILFNFNGNHEYVYFNKNNEMKPFYASKFSILIDKKILKLEDDYTPIDENLIKLLSETYTLQNVYFRMFDHDRSNYNYEQGNKIPDYYIIADKKLKIFDIFSTTAQLQFQL